MLLKTVELTEGALVLFVGVHAVEWKHEWGEPTVGAVELGDEDLAEMKRQCAGCDALLAALTAERDSWADEARDAKGEVIRVSAERNAARSACIAFRSWLAAYPAIDPGSLENVARLVVAALKE